MSLKPMTIEPVPASTVQVARAAFPRGNVYLTLRDELGTLFRDEAFADLFASCGQPALPPWRLAVVTLLQFRENLSDRQAADAVRARIDWKYLWGLELSDSGFDFSVLSEFRSRLVKAQASERLRDLLLGWCQRQGWLRAGGRQRTDATHVLAAVRQLNRLERVAETLRAALNAIATVAPDWLQARVPEPWYQRYGRRIEYSRRPSSEAERMAKGQSMGEDGVRLLTWLDAPDTPAQLTALVEVQTLRTVWQRHYRRESAMDGEHEPDQEDQARRSRVRLATPAELAQAPQALESPYDVQARYRTKSGLGWMGYTVHLSETCEAEAVHLITHVQTTPANVAEAKCPQAIQQALLKQGRAPGIHLADAGYLAADLLVSSQAQRGIRLVGPVHESARWQDKGEGTYSWEQFKIDWAAKIAHCPQGHRSVRGQPFECATGHTYIRVTFARQDCAACPERPRCTRAKGQPRRLQLQPQAQQEALQQLRAYLKTEEGQALYKKRAGIEGTLSQGIRGFGLRRSRYIGLAKTHLQHVASAAAMNLDRLAAWFAHRPLAKTRVSRFAALAS
jgi:transposase